MSTQPSFAPEKFMGIYDFERLLLPVVGLDKSGELNWKHLHYISAMSASYTDLSYLSYFVGEYIVEKGELRSC